MNGDASADSNAGRDGDANGDASMDDNAREDSDVSTDGNAGGDGDDVNGDASADSNVGRDSDANGDVSVDTSPGASMNGSGQVRRPVGDAAGGCCAIGRFFWFIFHFSSPPCPNPPREMHGHIN